MVLDSVERFVSDFDGTFTRLPFDFEAQVEAEG